MSPAGRSESAARVRIWALVRLGAAWGGGGVLIWLDEARIVGAALIALGLLLAFTPRGAGLVGRYPSGLGLRGVGKAFRSALPLLLASAALVGGWALYQGGPTPGLLAIRLVIYLGWALLQQAFLQTFTQNSLRCVHDRGPFTVVVASLLFAGIHLPNLPLVAISLPLALLLCTLFRRSPSIYPLAIVHALLGVFLDDVLDIPLKIGPGYFSR